MISFSVVVVAPLKPERIRSAKFNISGESFIWLKAGSCNKSAMLPGSTSTMCTSKSLLQNVSTSASQWGTITLFEFIRGKDMRQSIGLVSSRLLLAWTAFTQALTVAALKSFFCWRFDWY